MKNMTDRRKSDDYRQISGYIPRDLYRKFKAALALREMAQNEALEIAITKWLVEEDEK